MWNSESMLMVHIFSIFDWLILFLSKIKSELIFSSVAFLYKEKTQAEPCRSAYVSGGADDRT